MTRKTTTLEDALQDIRGSFGADSLVSLARNDAIEPVSVIPTGSTALDDALGVGGLPRGRVTEAFGAENSGKTTIALETVAQAQAQGLTCAFIDAEHSLDPKYAEAIGVDLGSLLLAQPFTAEEALEIAYRLTVGGVGMVVLDSLAAMTPLAELQGEMGEAVVGLKARLLGQATRKLVPAAHKTGTLLFLINQNRMAIGGYGNPVVQPGGKAVKYAAAVRAEVKRGQPAKRAGADPHKVECHVKIVKNKLAAPFRQAEFWIEFGVGIKDKR